MRAWAIAVLALSVAATIAAPLAGVALAGQPLRPYLGFPPRTVFVPHASFAWSMFSAFSIPVVAALALYAAALGRARPLPRPQPPGRFPGWGWIGLALVAAGWFLAWSDNVVPAPWRRHTFTPLWLGYIVVMNALVQRSAGWSLLSWRRGWFLALFAVSAGFWWLFEFLNQFVHNWYYTGIDSLGDWDYFLQATLPFSTVLPAVASTWAWLRQFPRLDAIGLPPLRGRAAYAWLALAAGALSLAGIGAWPQVLFCALWLGPLLVLAGLQQLIAGRSLLAPIAQGDWRPLLQPALAALVCGFFWELWNFGAYAKWHYSIPYAQRFPVFEMPLLGYAGYLPFGVECALVMDLVARLTGHSSVWPLGVAANERPQRPIPAQAR